MITCNPKPPTPDAEIGVSSHSEVLTIPEDLVVRYTLKVGEMEKKMCGDNRLGSQKLYLNNNNNNKEDLGDRKIENQTVLHFFIFAWK